MDPFHDTTFAEVALETDVGVDGEGDDAVMRLVLRPMNVLMRPRLSCMGPPLLRVVRACVCVFVGVGVGVV